jgi:hypothetical protein
MNLLVEFVQLLLKESTPEAWRQRKDEEFETVVQELMLEPHFASTDAFESYKIDNDEFSFNSAELQALARVQDEKRLGHEIGVASQVTTTNIKAKLVSDGFKFEPRLATRFFRGTSSSAHGRHPMAGTGGGGTGFGSSFGRTSFTSFGGGPGAIGGDYEWKASDARNLPMGSGRKR